jgi:uncharacterized membrane protein
LNIFQKYSLAKMLFRVGVLAAVALAVSAVRFYKPAYDAIDTLVILAIGMMLGAVYVQSRDRISKHFARKGKEPSKQKAETEPASHSSVAG